MELFVGRLFVLELALILSFGYGSVLIGGNVSIQQLIDQIIEDEVEKLDIDTEHCKMPQLRVLSSEILRLRSRHRHRTTESCTAKRPRLVGSQWNSRRHQYQLRIQQQVAAQLLGDERPIVECSYRAIEERPDNHVRLRQPVTFKDLHLVPKDVQSMLLQCDLGANQTYAMHTRRVSEGLAFVQPKEEAPRMGQRQPSVLVLGIDSMSRGNLRRVLPQVSDFLGGRHWHEMRGFNAVGDSNLTDCLDRLPLVWKDFKFAGYVTAISADSPEIAQCQRPPVDHYLPPLPMLKPKPRTCQRKRLSMEHTLDYCTQLIERYVRGVQPFFGLFWTNLFRSDGHAEPSDNDELLHDYLKRFDALGLYDQAIVVLLSDHGMQFGELLHLPDGQLEERQPMLFVSLPKWFRQRHPKFAHALQLNSHRLCSPHDLQQTLKHIASLQVAHESPPSCPRCQSLLYALPKDRTCSDAGIGPHWCTCEAYKVLPLSDRIQTMAHFVVQRINQFLTDLRLLNRCSKLRLSGIRRAQKKERSPHDDPSVCYYRIQLEALPNRLVFEATVSYNELTHLMDTDMMEISRQNAFDGDASCIRHRKVQRFCVCHDRITAN
ncbi:uncharacterized protein LOC111079861 [Drosophila obscura]|uniref:uncharacterized protein LOC111079861 n=1 Tax=Drosophila obscura TaxID=7282 RepID=UPI001BB1313F|nr:uncharacterized protein LOC111079861 [Drosophila obscura]